MLSAKMVAQYLPMVGVLLVVIIGYLVYMMYMRGKYAKEAAEKVWCEFFRRSGDVQDMLLRENHGEIRTISDKAHKKPMKSGAWVDAPEGHNIGKYFVIPQMAFNALWPPGKPRSMQQTIKKVAFIENYPLPIASINPEEWLDPEFSARVTAHLIDVSSDEAVARATQEMQKEVYGDMHTMATKFKNIEYTLYAACGSAALSGIAAYLVYSNGAEAVKLIKALAAASGHPL